MKKIKIDQSIKKGTIWISIGYLGSIIGFYPGFMSPDSFNQYFQAITGNFNDHHPVIMAVLWGELQKWISGPFLMLLFQTSLYWLSILILYLKANKYGKSNWILFIAFAPFLISTLGVVWKDIQFATGALLLVATSFDRPKFQRRLSAYIILVSELLLLLYISNVRANSWAVIPFVTYIWLNSYMPSLAKVKTALLAFLITASCFIFGQYFSNSIVEAKRTNITNDYVVDGLFFFSVKERVSLIPGVQYEDIVNCSYQDIAGMKLNGRFFCLNMTGKYDTSTMDPNVLNAKLAKKVISDPIGFAMMKISAFSEFQGNFWEKNYYYWHNGIEKNDLGISQTDNFFTLGIKNISDLTATIIPFVFAPIFWLWLSTLMVSLTWLRRKFRFGYVGLCLALSGFLYNFQNILAAGGPDFRYFYWSAISTCLAFAISSLDKSMSVINDLKFASAKWKIFWILTTFICLFHSHLFRIVSYESLLNA